MKETNIFPIVHPIQGFCKFFSVVAVLGMFSLLLIDQVFFLENRYSIDFLKCIFSTGSQSNLSSCDHLTTQSPILKSRLLGIFTYQTGNSIEAIQLLEQALKERPIDDVSIFWLGHAYYSSGKPTDALIRWEKLEVRNLATYFRLRSRYALKKGEISSSIGFGRLCVEVDPEYGPGFYQLGQAFFHNGDLSEAINAFQRALALEMETEERGLAYYRLGKVFRSQGRDQNALENFYLALQLIPDSYLLRRDLGDLLAEKRRYTEALFHLRKLLNNSPFDPSVLVRIGNIFLDQKYYADAEKWYLLAVSAEPTSGIGESALARLYGQQGRFEKAVEYFNKSIELNPGNTWVYFSLGSIYLQAGQTEQAIDIYTWLTEQELEVHSLEKAWLSLANLYTNQDNVELAKLAWQSVLKLNPSNATALHALTRVN